jgi:hypothetical protein
VCAQSADRFRLRARFFQFAFHFSCAVVVVVVPPHMITSTVLMQNKTLGKLRIVANAQNLPCMVRLYSGIRAIIVLSVPLIIVVDPLKAWFLLPLPPPPPRDETSS